MQVIGITVASEQIRDASACWHETGAGRLCTQPVLSARAVRVRAVSRRNEAATRDTHPVTLSSPQARGMSLWRTADTDE